MHNVAPSTDEKVVSRCIFLGPMYFELTTPAKKGMKMLGKDMTEKIRLNCTEFISKISKIWR